MSADDRLTPKQRAAIAALLAGETYGAAATAAQISPKTLFRWRADPVFVAELRAGQAELIRAATAALASAAHPAVNVLRAILEDPDARPGERIRAAAVILEQLLRLKEQVDLEARILALEEAAQHATA